MKDRFSWSSPRTRRALVTGVASVVCVSASFAALAPAASAMIAPHAGGTAPIPGGIGSTPATGHPVHTMVVSPGMPDWQVALITAGVAILGVAVAKLVGWTRTRRQVSSASV